MFQQVVPIEENELNPNMDLEQHNNNLPQAIVNLQQQQQEFLQLQHLQLTKLFHNTIIKFILQGVEFILIIIAFILLPHQCSNTTLYDFYIMAIVVDSQETFSYLQLMLLVMSDLSEIKEFGIENKIPYPEYVYQETRQLTGAIMDNNICFKIHKYSIAMLEFAVFINSQITLYQNINSSCQLGQSEFSYTWGIAFMFLIIRYIIIGIPTLIYLIYGFIIPILYCCNCTEVYKKRKVGATDQNITKLECHKVGRDILLKEIECIICLQQFIEGEDYIVLKCHREHIFHKQCISDWLKTRAECPKCRQQVEFI